MAKTSIKKKRNKEKEQLSLTPFMQYNAGDVEKNIKAFNHAMGQDKEQGEDVEMTQGEMTTSSEGGAGTGMGESMKSKSIYEELRNVVDIDEKSREIANPDFAAAVREIKKNNKARDEAGKVRKAPESGKEALPKDLGPIKVELEESLFNEATTIPRNAKKIRVSPASRAYGGTMALTKTNPDTWTDEKGANYSGKFLRTYFDKIDVEETDPDYQPKRTKEVSVLQGKYAGYWEDIIEYTVDTPREEIRDDFKSYEENEPNYAHRLIRRRVPISESLVESAKVEITSFDMKPLGSGYPWYAYTVEFSDGTRYDGQAKVFYEPSFYSIYGGRVSKFTMKDLDGNLLANYDRGWDVKPKERAKMEKVVQKLDAQQEDEYIGDSNYKDVYAILQGNRDSWEEIDRYDTEQEAQKEIEKMKSPGYKYRIRKMKQPIDEKLENGEIDDYFNKAKRLGVKTLGDLQNLMKNDSETAVDGSDMQKMDNYYKKANPTDKDLSDDTLGNMSDDDIVRIILASCKGKPDNIFVGKNRENLIKRFAARYPEKSVEEWEKLVKTAMDCRFGVSK